MSEAEIWRLVRLACPLPPLTEAEEAAVVLPPLLRDPAAILARHIKEDAMSSERPAELAVERARTAATKTGDGTLQQAPERMLKWFEYAHLPEKLQAISKPFGDLANRLAADVPQGPERTIALRKLLEAKDAAVRAALNPGC